MVHMYPTLLRLQADRLAGLDRFSQPLEKTENIDRRPQQEVAKIVHCGLPRLDVSLVGAYASMLGTRSDWRICQDHLTQKRLERFGKQP
jgi:hypothetical protein